MDLLSILVIACIISVSLAASPIKVYADHRTNGGYYSLFFENIDANACGLSITSIQLKDASGSYKNNDQYYYESNEPPYHRYAWITNNINTFPVSVNIILSNGLNIELKDIVSNSNSNSIFTSTATICGNTLAPTAPTKAPTTKSPTPPTTAYPTAQSICVDADKLDWRSYDNELKLNGNRFNMKGLSWFGYETPNNGLYGLDRHSEDWYFQFMKDNGFNAMRLPFASDWLFSGTSLNSGSFAKYKATIQNAQNYGIFVMPDMHSKNIGSWMDGLNTINKADAIKQWAALAEGLKNEWNVFIADIFNEPHDVSNGAWGEWIQFNEDAAAAIWATGVNWMIGVEGTNHECSVINCCWGENLEGVRNTGITFDLESHGENRFVWAQHVYGADVSGNPYSTAGWKAHWGYLFDGSYPQNKAAGLIGEFGTRYTGGMVNWLDDLVDYLISIDQRNTFYWCLNPNSGDTGGLLADDWTTPMTGKLAALDKLQPNPSVVQYNSNTKKVCIQFEGGSGSMATPSPVTTTTKAPTTKTPTRSTTTIAPTTKTPTTSTTPSPPTRTTTKSPTTTTTKAPTTKSPTKSAGSGSGEYIVIKNHKASQSWYYSFQLDNSDASMCNDAISTAYILIQGSWRAANHNDDDTGTANGWRWGFDHPGFAFDHMLPISLRIEMTSGRIIELMEYVTSLSPGAEFVTKEMLCEGTFAPTAPTVAPTPKAPTAPTTPYPTAPTLCIDKAALDWRSYDNELKLNGNRFNMKGLSWFGYETPNNGLYGLDRHSEDWYFQFMKDNGFNAMRLPFASDWLFSGTSLNSGSFAKYKATIQKAQNYGIFVMPDMHSKNIGSWRDGLNTLNKADAIKQWGALAEGLKNEWNVFIADIFNEPHDVSNGQWAEWIQFNEDAADAIWATGVNWMIGVEGTNHECSVINCCWGENLEGVRNTGVAFDNEKSGENRFVWAQHVYGADVAGNPYSKAGWKAHWGYLFDGSYPQNKAAGLIGEFGTRYTGNMVNWLDDLVDYLIEIDQRNTFYWCLNPNSGDTGGLLADDWTTPMSGKLAALDKLQPNPSKVVYNAGSGQVCVSFEGGSAYYDDENLDVEDSDNDLGALEIAAFVVMAVIIIAIIGGIICYVRKRKNSQNIMNKTVEIEDDDGDNTPEAETDGMVQLTEQTNVVAIQEEDVDDV